jgi:hypothetical protein
MTGVGSGEPAARPSGPGAVVLELGAGAGALILHTPAELNGTEIDIGPADGHGRRTHALVRPRHIAGGTRYAAVYQDLPPGEYTIWHGDGRPAITVAVAGAVVTTAAWPGG